MLLRLLCCVLLLWLSRDHVTSLDLEPGISEALAVDRARRVSDVRYALSFVIPELKGQPIEGRAEIRLRLSDASRPLALDFQATPSQVRGVTVAGRAAPSAIVNGHLVVTPEWLATGENEIAIEFTAGDVPFNRQDDFLYTLFVPARAHEAFPCFDQPDLKARVSLTLDVPAGWTAAPTPRSSIAPPPPAVRASASPSLSRSRRTSSRSPPANYLSTWPRATTARSA